MSDTPKLPDECKKILDNGWQIVLWKNPLGSYSAEATRGTCEADCEIIETDDFEPLQALYRLTEKMFGNIV